MRHVTKLSGYTISLAVGCTEILATFELFDQSFRSIATRAEKGGANNIATIAGQIATVCVMLSAIIYMKSRQAQAPNASDDTLPLIQTIPKHNTLKFIVHSLAGSIFIVNELCLKIYAIRSTTHPAAALAFNTVGIPTCLFQDVWFVINSLPEQQLPTPIKTIRSYLNTFAHRRAGKGLNIIATIYRGLVSKISLWDVLYQQKQNTIPPFIQYIIKFQLINPNSLFLKWSDHQKINEIRHSGKTNKGAYLAVPLMLSSYAIEDSILYALCIISLTDLSARYFFACYLAFCFFAVLAHTQKTINTANSLISRCKNRCFFRKPTAVAAGTSSVISSSDDASTLASDDGDTNNSFSDIESKLITKPK